MAIGWVTLLKTVPWTEVIASAPAVADGAKKLWKTVGKKKVTTPVDVGAAIDPAASEANDIAARLQELEATVAELQSQMLASSELITALAGQNAELVKRAEANRVRLLWLSVALIGLVGVVLVVLFR